MPGDILELWSSPYEELGSFVISSPASPDVYKGMVDVTATGSPWQLPHLAGTCTHRFRRLDWAAREVLGDREGYRPSCPKVGMALNPRRKDS